MPERCWLLKTEADCFSIHDLAAAPGQTAFWNGVRNFQARNFLRDDMKIGDRVLFYHSNDQPSAIAGTAIVVREGYPDHTAWDKSDSDYDPKASAENPIWQMVDIRLEAIFEEPLPLALLRQVPQLKQMELLRKGSRLSVQPVTPAEFATVLRLSKGTVPVRTAKSSTSQVSTFRKTTAKEGVAKKGAGTKRAAKKGRRPASAK
jgi:predicted RNA-binding protein with PUA-like domain